MTIRMTRKQLMLIIENNLLEVTQDFNVDSGFTMELTTCDLSKMDNRFIKAFTSPTESVIAKIRTFLSDINMEGIFKLLNIVIVPLKLAGVLLHSGQLVINSVNDSFFNVLKKIASLTAWTAMIPLGNICDTIVNISEIIGEIVGPILGISKSAGSSLKRSDSDKDRSEYISSFINGLKNEFDVNKEVRDLSLIFGSASINALTYMAVFMPGTTKNYLEDTTTLLGNKVVSSEANHVKSLLKEMKGTSTTKSYSGIQSRFSGKTLVAIPFTNTSKIESVFSSLPNPTDYYDYPQHFIVDLSKGLEDIQKLGLLI